MFFKSDYEYTVNNRDKQHAFRWWLQNDFEKCTDILIAHHGYLSVPPDLSERRYRIIRVFVF